MSDYIADDGLLYRRDATRGSAERIGVFFDREDARRVARALNQAQERFDILLWLHAELTWKCAALMAAFEAGSGDGA